MSKINDNTRAKIDALQKEKEQLQSKIDSLEKANQEALNSKVSFTKWLGSMFIGKGLKSSLNTLFDELPNKVTKATLADVTANVMWRFTRIGFFAAFFATIPIWLLYQQNQKIEVQNGLFTFQNERVKEQTLLLESQNSLVKEQSYLAEASRRSSLVFMMSNIMDKVGDELQANNASEEPYHLSRKISNLTIGRIAALSHALQPINYMDGDTLVSKPISPERGQLLLSLVNSLLDTTETYRKIYERNYFGESDLKLANLNGAYMPVVFLAETNLYGATLKKANLYGAYMPRSYLRGASLNQANLNMADLNEANLSNADLRKANLCGANLSRANLKEAGLSRAKLCGTDLRNADLSGAYFSKADLTGADLRGANLNKIDLRNVDLNQVVVESIDWFDTKTNKNILGIEALMKKYYVDKQVYTDNSGEEYYLIEEIQN